MTNKMGLLTKFIDPFSTSFLNYFRLWSYIDKRLINIISRGRTHKYKEVSKFWRDVHNKDIKAGDRIILKEVFLTEWVPRLPGELWKKSIDAKTKKVGVTEAERIIETPNIPKIIFFSSFYPNLLRNPPVGVVRFPYNMSRHYYTVLSATSLEGWFCDLGIPIIVSKPVFGKFLEARLKNNSVEADITGYLVIDEALDIFENKLTWNMVPQEFKKVIQENRTLMKAYLLIDSPLDIKCRTHGQHPPAFIWAFRKSQLKNITTPSKKYPDQYEFLSVSTDTKDANVMRNITNWLRSSSFKINDDDEELVFCPFQVVTEFDTRGENLNPLLPFRKDGRNNADIRATMSMLLTELHQLITDNYQRKLKK
jgi:hypothetical protein